MPGSLVITRMVAYEGEVFRVPEGRFLRVVSGKAWLTHGGRDVVLRPGERAWLGGQDDVALVSSLGSQPVIFELTATDDRRTPGRRISVTALHGGVA